MAPRKVATEDCTDTGKELGTTGDDLGSGAAVGVRRDFVVGAVRGRLCCGDRPSVADVEVAAAAGVADLVLVPVGGCVSGRLCRCGDRPGVVDVEVAAAASVADLVLVLVSGCVAGGVRLGRVVVATVAPAAASAACDAVDVRIARAQQAVFESVERRLLCGVPSRAAAGK